MQWCIVNSYTVHSTCTSVCPDTTIYTVVLYLCPDTSIYTVVLYLCPDTSILCTCRDIHNICNYANVVNGVQERNA